MEQFNLGFTYYIGPGHSSPIYVDHSEVMALSERVDTWNRVLASGLADGETTLHSQVQAEQLKTLRWAHDVLIAALESAVGTCTVESFQVQDLGEDGSQYFPGVSAVYTPWQRIEVGMGDTSRDALEDALEQMACDSPEAVLSPYQEAQMLAGLRHPDYNCHSRCGDECHSEDEAHDWHHYVAVFYNLTSEVK